MPLWAVNRPFFVADVVLLLFVKGFTIDCISLWLSIAYDFFLFHKSFSCLISIHTPCSLIHNWQWTKRSCCSVSYHVSLSLIYNCSVKLVLWHLITPKIQLPCYETPAFLLFRREIYILFFIIFKTRKKKSVIVHCITFTFTKIKTH